MTTKTTLTELAAELTRHLAGKTIDRVEAVGDCGLDFITQPDATDIQDYERHDH